jgi:hypothetical protein
MLTTEANSTTAVAVAVVEEQQPEGKLVVTHLLTDREMAEMVVLG